MARKNTNSRQMYSDSVHTRNKGLVRLSELDPDEKLLIGDRWVTVGDIPLTAAFLSCGHPIRGIALQEKDVIFCESCHQDVFVASVNP